MGKTNKLSVGAREHFIAISDPGKAIAELNDALDEGFILMHRRAYYKLNDAKAKYLGKDVYAEQIDAEWNSLTPQQQAEIETDPKGLGKFGMFDLVSRKEVPLALHVAARLISKEFELSAYVRDLLDDPQMVKTITTRFPIITEVHIQQALEI